MIEKNGFSNDMIFDFTSKDEPIFEEIKEYIKKLGIAISPVYIKPRSGSNLAIKNSNGEISKVPVLSLYTASTDDYNKFIAQSGCMGLVIGAMRNKIVAKWKKLCISHKLDVHEFYDEDMYVRLINAQAIVADHVIRNIKNQTYEIIAEYSKVTPMYIFASSEPCYNIVFKNHKDFMDAESSFDDITSAVKEIVAQNSCLILGQPAEDILKINYMHHEDKSINFCGLSRED